MASDHVDEDVLLEYLDGAASADEAAAIERHLADCDTCSSMVDGYRSMAAALKDKETWLIADEITDGAAAQSMLSFAARRIAEDAEANRLLEPFLNFPYHFMYANLALRPRFQTGGVVRRLCREAHEQWFRDPLFARTLADAAVSIADGLPDDYYPSRVVNQLRGDAWKEYSTACRFLGRFQEGLDALDRAARAYRRTNTSGLNLAVVDLARSILLWKQERYDEALVIVRTAEAAFVEYRDTLRFIEAKQVEAVILQRKGDVSAARAIHHQVFDEADALEDLGLKAGAAQNLGVSYTETDPGEASKYFLIALQLYEHLELRTELVRARWGIALVALSVGNFSEAARRLREVEGEFESLEMLGDASRVKLDLAEALLMLGQVDEAYELSASLVVFFRQANMITGAITAASFLKEAAAKRTLTLQQIRHVRRYLSDLEGQPDLIFALADDGTNHKDFPPSGSSL